MILIARIIVLVSSETKQKWTAYAKANGISVGELIRTAVKKEIGK